MTCRICNSKNTETLLNFGNQPIVHHLLKDKDDIYEKFNLSLSICNDCSFLFLTNPISPKILYNKYLTFSSWKNQNHANKIIEHIQNIFGKNINLSILEIGSNDGSFIEILQKYGYKNVTGVEPSTDVYKISRDKNQKVYNEFFSSKIYPFNESKGHFEIIITRHVLEHIENLITFLSDIRFVMNDEGLLVVEIPDFDGWLENLDYSLWEEHINCFTIEVIDYLFKKSGFLIFHYEKFLFSGRSMTIYAKKIQNLINIKKPKVSFEKIDKYVLNFEYLKNKMNEFLSTHKDISVYGCGARSCVLSNIFDLNINRFIDDQPEKQNLFVPGKLVPVEKWNDNFRSSFIILGVLFENEKKIIDQHKLKNKNYFSFLPPSTNLPNFWRSIL